jgi:hypothetical protein
MQELKSALAERRLKAQKTKPAEAGFDWGNCSVPPIFRSSIQSDMQTV